MTDLLYPFIQLMPNARSPSANAQLPMTNYQSNLYWIRYEILHPLIHLKISKKGPSRGVRAHFPEQRLVIKPLSKGGKDIGYVSIILSGSCCLGSSNSCMMIWGHQVVLLRQVIIWFRVHCCLMNRMDLDIATRARERWHNFHAPSRLLRSPVY